MQLLTYLILFSAVYIYMKQSKEKPVDFIGPDGNTGQEILERLEDLIHLIVLLTDSLGVLIDTPDSLRDVGENHQ
jgi:hypothetical protein